MYNNFNNGGYRQGGYQRRNYGYGQGYNQGQPRQQKKRSGCRYKSSFVSKTTGQVVNEPLLHGWNYSRSRGLISFVASLRKDKDKRKTANKDWQLMAVKVNFKDGVKIFNGFYRDRDQKLIIPDLQMVANPNAPNGGYFGRYYRTKN